MFGFCLWIDMLAFQYHQLCAWIIPGPLGLFLHLFPLHTHPSPVGQMFLSPHYRGINLGWGSSVVMKARVQTQSHLPCPRPIPLPLSYLEIPNYKPPPTSFHHATRLLSFLLYIHTLYSPAMMKIFTLMASYYLIFIPAASSPHFCLVFSLPFWLQHTWELL